MLNAPANPKRKKELQTLLYPSRRLQLSFKLSSFSVCNLLQSRPVASNMCCKYQDLYPVPPPLAQFKTQV
jgi:hypothetical protein